MNTDALKIESVTLPLSGQLFQWRDDMRWRRVSVQQAEAEAQGVFVPQEGEWIPWTGTIHGSATAQRFGSDSPTWWLVYDELPAPQVPVVQLSDGTSPPVTVLGRIWMCEWVSLPQVASVISDSCSYQVFDHRPQFL